MRRVSSLFASLYVLVLCTAALFNISKTYAIDTLPKVTQAAYVSFKVSGVALVLAVEEFNKSPMLIVRQHPEHGMALLNTIIFDNGFKADDHQSSINSFLRFKQLHITDMFSPILVGVAVQPGGSDIGFDVKLIAEANGRIVDLTPGKMILSLEDGFFIGYINSTYANGLIIWKMQWSDKETHSGPHIYNIYIYKLRGDNSMFNLYNKLVTTQRFKTGCEALNSYSLPCKNFIDDIVDIDDNTSTLGTEVLIPQHNSSE
jgi:hypothetical protein